MCVRKSVPALWYNGFIALIKYGHGIRNACYLVTQRTTLNTREYDKLKTNYFDILRKEDFCNMLHQLFN